MYKPFAFSFKGRNSFETRQSQVITRWLLLGGMIFLLCGCEQNTKDIWTLQSDARFRMGDDIRWAHPEWDDSAWSLSPLIDLPDSAAVMWVRLEMPVQPVETLGLDVAGLAAREIYWNGVLVGQSGQVGHDATHEQPGPIDTIYRIPDSLAFPGIHQIALRLSTFRRPINTSGLRMELLAGEYTSLSIGPLQSIGIPLLFLGGFVLIAFYYTVLFFADHRRLPYLLTAILCISVAALLIAEGWRIAFGYTYDHHAFRLGIIEILTATVGVLLSAAFAIQYDVPKTWNLIGVLALGIGVVLFLIQDHETSTYAVFFISLIVALGLIGWGIKHEKSGAFLAFAGVGICFGSLLISGYDFMDRAFFPAFGLLVAGLLTSLGLQAREDQRKHNRALATAARLEAELLKKHLQPHFLMNTLTSILELLETKPAQGALAIESLAKELRSLTDVSGEKLIPMQHELELCRAQLKVLGYRHAIQFELDATGVDPEKKIPPAIIHTLIENAVTHNAYTTGRITFTLCESQSGDYRRLTLKTPLAQALREPRKEGGGLRYIRTRLEEAAPGKWKLASEAREDMWVTKIDLQIDG